MAQIKWNKLIVKTWGAILTAGSVSTLIVIFRLLGWLEPLELKAYDLFIRLKIRSPTDTRILVVEWRESDIQKYGEAIINDSRLADSISKISDANPRIIVLDLVRDLPQPPGYEKLAKVFQETENLIGIEKTSAGEFDPPIAPSPVLKKAGRVSASDLILDEDGVVRRAYLYLSETNKKDVAISSVGLEAALQYLAKERIKPTGAGDENWLKLNDTVFVGLNQNSGGYVETDVDNYQILVKFPHPKTLEKVSVADILEGRVSSDKIRNRIIYIGRAAESFHDIYFTPYQVEFIENTPVYGVEIHALITSFILDAVLENRPLIKVWSDEWEHLWTVLWISLPVFLIWGLRQRFSRQLFIIVIGVLVFGLLLLFVICYLNFFFGWWLPLIPPFLGLLVAVAALINCIYLERITILNVRLIKLNTNLEDLVKHRTQQLKNAQKQMIAQEKLNMLGKNVAGIAHEIKNPLSLILQLQNLCLESASELQLEINRCSPNLDAEISELLGLNLTTIIEDIRESQQLGERIKRIIRNIERQSNPINSPPSWFDINKLVNDSVKMSYYSQRSRYQDFYVQIEEKYDNSIGEIKIVGEDISRALINIIDNACYAVYQKQKQLGQEYRPTIRITTKNLENSIQITVQDNGQGIPSDKLDDIFREFVTTKLPGEGTGLGLYIALEIIKGKHGGDIRVETELDQYTKFIIVLPKSQNQYQNSI